MRRCVLLLVGLLLIVTSLAALPATTPAAKKAGSKASRTAPVNNFPSTVSFAEDDSLTVDASLYVSDADGDQLYLAASETNHVHITISGMSVKFKSDPDWNGQEVVAFSVSDQPIRAGNRSITTKLVTVVVTPVQDAPVLSIPTPLVLNEDSSLTIDLSPYISSTDNGTITLYAAQVPPMTLDININNKVVTITPQANWNGMKQVIFSVSERVANQTPQTAVSSQEVVVQVNSVNDQPIYSGFLPNTPVVWVDQFEDQDYTLLASDVDNDIVYDWYIDGTLQTNHNATFTSNFLLPGVYTVRGVVYDSEYSYENSWTVNVHPVGPTFDPLAGTYTTPIDVTLETVLTGGTIYYTLDGSDPDENSLVYTGPIHIPLDTYYLIKAKAYKAGEVSTQITSAAYTVTGQLADLSFTPNAGIYTAAQSVTIHSTDPGVTIYWTDNGDEPTTSSTVYSGPITVPLNSSMTIRAKAYKTDWIPSNIGQVAYTVTGQVSLADPLFGTAPGTYTTAQSVTIDTTTLPVGATVRYTLNGQDPDENSPVYTTPIAIGLNTSRVIKVRAFKQDWLPSDVVTGIFTVTGQATITNPVFSPVAGTYTTAQDVSINAAYPAGTVVHYTTDGSDPTETSPLYTTSIHIPLNTTMVIKARAYKVGWAASPIQSATYNVTGQLVMDAPVFSLTEGTYQTVQFVSVGTSTPAGTVYYTTDGSEPTQSSTVYSGPIQLGLNSETTIRVRAYRAGWAASAIHSATYTITGQLAFQAPAFNPPAGIYTSQRNVVINASIPDGAVVHYTTNGDDPTETSPIYNGPISVPLNTTMTIKAKAYMTDWDPSDIIAATYQVTGRVDTPYFTPIPGIYATQQLVTIQTVTAGTTIHYTTNGDDPTELSPVYINPIQTPNAATVTIKAIATKDNWDTSEIGTASYQIGILPAPAFTVAPGIYTTAQFVGINSPIANTAIHYTVDGSVPTLASPLYTTPITVALNSTVQIRAIVTANGWQSSQETAGTFQVTGTVSNPVFNPAPGIYSNTLNVSITSFPADAIIRYTTDSNLSLSENVGTIYTGPFEIASSTTVRAIAYKQDWATSGIVVADYTLTGSIASPAINPPSGTYTTIQQVTMTTVPADAIIRYTLDGSTPDELSPAYVGPIELALNQNVTVKAKAFKNGWAASGVVENVYHMTGTVATPTFQPVSGIYTTAQDVTIQTTTNGAEIRYTTDGTEPNGSSSLYTTAINVPLNTSMTIRAKAYKTDWTTSDAASGVYNVTGQVAISSPVFSPAEGIYTSAQDVSINSTVLPAGANLYYTLDGSDPTPASTLYGGAIHLAQNSSQTIRVRAYANNWIVSPIYSANYQITGQVAITAPVFTPVAGTYVTAQYVKIATTTVPAGATIRYTTDGSDPSELSPAYVDSILVASNTSMTIRARAFFPNWLPSEITSAAYNVTGQITFNNPVFSPAAGTYQTPVSVTINSPIPSDAQLYYTIDGTIPTELSTPYNGAILIPLDSNVTIKVKAFKNGWSSSTVEEAIYNVTGQVAASLPVFAPASGVYTSAQTVMINPILNPNGAIWYYTTDGTEPTTSSTPYAGAISIPLNSSMTIKARAFMNGWTPSPIYTANYLVTGQIETATPMFLPAPGTYREDKYITLNTNTSPAGATIRYTTDGSEPTAASAIYTTPILVALNSSMVIKAQAYKENWLPSEVVSGVYNVIGPIAIGAPVFTPGSGTYSTAQDIVLSNSLYPSDASIYYTLDGSEPTTASTPYTTPIHLAENTNTILKIRAFRNGWDPSPVYTATYLINGKVTMGNPVFIPAAGTYATAKDIIINNAVTPTDASVYYTLDDTDPTTSSTPYYGPIHLGLNTETVIKVRAFRNGWEPSDVVRGVFVINNTVTAPTFQPVAGTYTVAQSVQISSTTAGATIRYTTDGTEPSETNGTLYNGSFLIANSTTVKAIAFKQDWGTSNVVSASYMITGTVATPSITPASGTYQVAQVVSMTTTTPEATIRYTMDGTEPTEFSVAYTAPFTVPLNTDVTITAKAFKAGWANSSAAQVVYHVTGKVATPEILPGTGIYASSQVVTISTVTANATIRYTTDGSIPTASNGLVYSTPITVTSSQTIKAVAYKTDWTISDVAQAAYTITGTVASPSFTPGTGIYNVAQSVTITTTTPGATIRYTLDGSTPTETNGTIYMSPVAINNSATLKAVAYKANWLTSQVSNAVYTLTGSVAMPMISPNTGTYAVAQNITITANPTDAIIRYTTDGSIPTETVGTVYTGSFNIANSTTIHAIAYKADWVTSPVAQAVIEITGAISVPSFNPIAGTYTSAQTVTITAVPANATIRYTLDGNAPSETTGLVYSGPIQVASSQMIRAIAYKTGWLTSAIGSANYVITGTVAAPQIMPASGIYTTAQNVTMTSQTVGSSIRYTTDGSTPSETNGNLYVGNFLVPSSTTVKAIAYKTDWTTSTVTTATYTITGTVATPTINPVSGTYTTAQVVTMSTTTDGATIRYTTDGTDPTATSQGYTVPITVPLNTNITFKARAYKDNWEQSGVGLAQYVVTGTVATPIISLASGTYTSVQTVTLSSATSGSSIYYTLDGTDPSASSIAYTSAITLPMDTTVTLKAIAYKTDWVVSGIASATYQLTGKVAAPSFNPPSGNFTVSQDVAISCPTPQAVIRYTTDGSDPLISSTVYTVPINVPMNTAMTLKAKAFRTDWESSETTTAIYNVGVLPLPTFNPISGTYTMAQDVAISSSVVGTTIRYTLDGTEPNASSAVYNNPIHVGLNSLQVVKARAFKTGWGDSPVATATYLVTGQVADVVFNPASGNYTAAQNVILSSPTNGATIYYTTDGSLPNTSSTVYQTAVVVPLHTNNMQIKAIAVKENWISSNVTSASYTVTGQVVLNTPYFTPAPGLYTSAQSITVTNSVLPADAIIRYTTNGMDPTDQSPVLVNPVVVAANASTVIKVRAFRDGWIASDIISGIYTITGQVALSTPVLTPGSGNYTSAQNVVINTLTNPTGATIRYTVDGADPTENSPAYAGPITIPENAVTVVKVRAYKQGWIASDIFTGTYSVTGTVAFGMPAFNPVAGTYMTAQTVTINTAGTTGSTVRYTTDGTEPNETSAVYTAPITVPLNSSMTIKARAFKTGWLASVVQSASYTVTGQVSFQGTAFTPASGVYTTAQLVTINTSTSPTGTVIRYTTDGSDPNITSPIYQGGINVGLNTNMVIKARAYKADWVPSEIVTADYRVTGQVAMNTQVFTPASGTYQTAQYVTLSTVTTPTGAILRFTTDGSDPTETSALYSGLIPMPLNSSTTLKVKAFKTDWLPSETQTAQYVITGQVALSGPIFTPASGVYTSVQDVAITNAVFPTTAQVFYSVDGADPTMASLPYQGPIHLDLNSNTVIKVRAYNTDWTPSEVYTANYTITGQVAMSGTILTPTPGTYTTAQSVSIQPNLLPMNAVVRYSLDGTEPTENSPAYQSPIVLPLNSTTTVKVKAFATNWVSSEVIVGTYQITGTVATPILSLASGNYTVAQTVAIECATPGASIYYTTDGTEPTTSSTLYSEEIVLPIGTIQMGLKAKGFKDRWVSSTSASAQYTVLSPPLNVTLQTYSGYIEIRWNNPVAGRTLEGFNVYRRTSADTTYAKINSELIHDLYYRDYDIDTNTSYQYTVTAVYDGIESKGSVASAYLEYQSAELTVNEAHAYPNPATDNGTKITFVLSRDATCTVAIYDFAGKLVKQLPSIANATKAGNKVELPWDLKTNKGTKVARGVYFVRVVANDGTKTTEKIIKVAVK